jgi:hypothetical protein
MFGIQHDFALNKPIKIKIQLSNVFINSVIEKNQ